MLQLLFVIVTWGISGLFFKLARIRIDTISSLVWQTLGFLFVAVVMYGILRPPLALNFDGKGMLYAFLGGAFAIAGSYFFFEKLSVLPVSVIMPLMSLNVLLTAMLGVLFLREHLTLLQVISGLVMIGSAAIFAYGSAR